MGRNDLVFVIRTRPFLGGESWMPYSITPGASKVAVTSVAPELIPGLSETDIFVPPYGGGLLLSYKETASSVALRSWQSKAATFTFEIADSDDRFARNVIGKMPRGMIISVDAGFSGWTWDQFQRINLGTVRQVSNQQGKFAITCDEIWAAMTSPSGTASRSFGVAQSFSGAGSTFNITEAVGNEEATIDVDDVTKTAYAATDLRSGEDDFVVQTTDTADPSNTVYLKCDLSRASAGVIVRDTAEEADSIAHYDWFHQAIGFAEGASVSTTSSAIASGTACKMFYVVDDVFLNTFMRIATSTGAHGTAEQNGDWDTLHGALGFGVPLDLLWWADMHAWHLQWTGRKLDAFTWTPFFGSEADNGWSEISKALQNFGIWTTMKEGEITLRSAISHCGDIEGPGSRYDRITEDNIESIKKHEYFHTNCRNEYQRFDIALADIFGGTDITAPFDPEIDGKTVDTRPFSEAYEVSTVNGPRHYENPGEPDVTTCWNFQDTDGSSSARTFVALNSAWFTRVPEFAEIVTAGLMYAGLCPGDIVIVTASQLVGPEGAWESRPAMVQSVHRDWMRGRVTLGVAALPTKQNRYT